MIDQPDQNNSFADKANAAFEKAAVAVVERAKATGTPVIIWRDGKTVYLSPEEAERHLQQRIQKPEEGQS